MHIINLTQPVAVHGDEVSVIDICQPTKRGPEFNSVCAKFSGFVMASAQEAEKRNVAFVGELLKSMTQESLQAMQAQAQKPVEKQNDDITEKARDLIKVMSGDANFHTKLLEHFGALLKADPSIIKYDGNKEFGQMGWNNLYFKDAQTIAAAYAVAFMIG